MPGWMTRMSTLTPAKAGATAAALTVLNPKVLFICAAAGLAIGAAGGGAGTTCAAGASSTVTP
ncbi:GAP family protein [Mycolicibacterium austroafricanum]|uniref:GAP family protein n=1 Tax=Mycolicibacterium austroafricanum TaxID=39687 RepID=UPI002E28C599|nr:GAP family protein [Mycolicibacterium austroafricanum]